MPRLMWRNRKPQLRKVRKGVTFPGTFSLFAKISLDSCLVPEDPVAFKYIDPVYSSVPLCICESVLSGRGNLAYPIVCWGRVLPEVEFLNTSVCRPRISRCLSGWTMSCRILSMIPVPAVHFSAYYY